jgi:hypothetical protein
MEKGVPEKSYTYIPYPLKEMSTTGIRQPGCPGCSALGPWLCVLAFQRVCPFVPQRYLILLSCFKKNNCEQFDAKNVPFV